MMDDKELKINNSIAQAAIRDIKDIASKHNIQSIQLSYTFSNPVEYDRVIGYERRNDTSSEK